jgi:hypothetical protein
VPDQDYREDGEESPSSRGSLWCEQCLAGHYLATAVLQTGEVPSRSALPN